MNLVSVIEIIGLIFLISFAFMGTITLGLMSQGSVAWAEPNFIIRAIEIFGGIFGIIIAAKIISNKIKL